MLSTACTNSTWLSSEAPYGVRKRKRISRKRQQGLPQQVVVFNGEARLGACSLA
jgi:hypothetical protein